MGAERVAETALNPVRSLVRRFGHHIARVIDEVPVIAQAALNDICPGPTVQHIIPSCPV